MTQRIKILTTFLLAIFLLIAQTLYGLKEKPLINNRKNPECFEILDILSTMEGFDYSNIDIAKRMFGNEKINFEVETWKGKCYYGIGTLDGKVVIVSDKPFKNPTLLAFSDSRTIKMLFKNPDEKLFREALKTGRIRIEGVGFADRIKVSLVNTLGKLYPPFKEENKTNLTIIAPNLSWQNDYDGDGILNSEDACDPYLLKESLPGAGSVVYFTCPSSLSDSDVYLGNAPYLDIYDYVMNNGCGVKDTDGGKRYYTKGSIYVENVSYYRPTTIGRGPHAGHFLGSYASECKRIYTDYCLDDETLVEYYYEAPRRVLVQVPPSVQQAARRLGIQAEGATEVWVSGGIRNTTYKCPFGCRMGACILKDIDSPEWELGLPPSIINGEKAYGFNPWTRGYYGREGLEYISLKTGKSINEITENDFFGDECVNETTLREYYLTVEATWGVSGMLEDKIVIKSKEYTCPRKCSFGRCEPEHCFDGVKNQGEDDVDCGGPCYPCRASNVCTQTNAKFVPPDTPCDDKWRPGKNTMKCEVYEVCSDELDYIIEEAYRCAEYIVTDVNVGGFDMSLCSHVREVITQELGINLNILYPLFDRRKLVAGIYIVEGLGDSAFNRGWMNYYLHEEFCCNYVLSNYNEKSWCWGDVASCLKNNSAQPGNFWNMISLCLSQSNDARERSRLQLYQGFLKNITQMVCEQRRVDQVWQDDTSLSQNSIRPSVPPTHASINIMHTGTCADYSSAVTTLLRKAGYTCDEVFSVAYPGHVWNVVKFPGMDKWVVVDTTAGDRGGIQTTPKLITKKYCEVFNKTKNIEKGWIVPYPPYNDKNSPHYGARPLSNDCTGIYREAKLGMNTTYGRPADELIHSEKDVFGCD